MVSRKNAMVINFCEVASRVEFRLVFCAPSRKFKILVIPVLLAHGKSYKHSFVKKYDGHKLCAKSRTESSFDQFFMHHLGNSKYWPFPTVEFRSVFRALSRKLKIPAIPYIRVSIGFSCPVSKIQNTSHSRRINPRFEFLSVFHASSQKFIILAVPDVLAHGEPYEHGFGKKRDGHKLCAKSCTDSSFDRFFVHRHGNSKYWLFPTYLAQ
ncbi:hypothetical protein B296_00035991, partial [Ensete ventricosum]